jgi:hypothetical protein
MFTTKLNSAAIIPVDVVLLVFQVCHVTSITKGDGGVKSTCNYPFVDSIIIYIQIAFTQIEGIMARTKGSKNKDEMVRPATSELSTDQRVQLVANLIIDRIMYEEANGHQLLKEARRVELLCETT